MTNKFPLLLKPKNCILGKGKLIAILILWVLFLHPNNTIGATIGDFIAGSHNGIVYRLFVPKNYNPSLKYPLILFLHGEDERGSDNAIQVTKQAMMFAQDSNQIRWPSFVLVPQCPSSHQWVNTPIENGSYSIDTVVMSSALSEVHSLISDLQASYSLDSSRFYITGFSMGGYGTWDYISRYPNKFAAAIPICGAGDPSKAEFIKNIPLRFFHSSDDTIVPVTGSRDMDGAFAQPDTAIRFCSDDYCGAPYEWAGKDYCYREDAPINGVLFSAWTRLPSDWTNWHHNMNIFTLQGTNWNTVFLDGNVTQDYGEIYNANSMFGIKLSNGVGPYAGDYCFWQEHQDYNISKGWVWVAWQQIINSNSITLRQWLKFGKYGKVFKAQNTADPINQPESPSIQCFRDFVHAVDPSISQDLLNTWEPGGFTSFHIGDASPSNIIHARIEDRNTEPTLLELEKISNLTVADSTAWADYELNWKNGKPNLSDRSGHGRDLILAKGGQLFAGWDFGNSTQAKDAVYKEYSGIGHRCWSEAYETVDLLPWMFSQSNVSVATTTSKIASKNNDEVNDVYPNPAHNFIIIKNATINSQLSIYNMKGICCFHTVMMNDLSTINVADFTSGVYVVKYHSNDKIVTFKFIKQ